MTTATMTAWERKNYLDGYSYAMRWAMDNTSLLELLRSSGKRAGTKARRAFVAGMLAARNGAAGSYAAYLRQSFVSHARSKRRAA